MKKLVAMGACLVALGFTPVQGYAADPEVVVVRVYENAGKGQLVVTGPNGRSETVNFESGILSKKLQASGQAYHAVVTKLYLEGFGLTSTFSSTVSDSPNLITTLIFTKGD